MADQPFVVGPGISPVTVKLVFQIVAVKYVDLCDLRPTNLQAKEPGPQFLFHNCLVLMLQPKKLHWRIEGIVMGTKSSRSSPPFWCRTFLTAGGTFCNISFSSFVQICILAAMFGWPMTGPFMSMQRPHSSRTGRVWTLSCLIFMQREPLFICLHLTILLIGNWLVLREVLWSASLGTGGIALRLSPSAAMSTAAPPVLVRIMQRFF